MTQGNPSYPVAAALAVLWRDGRTVLVRRHTRIRDPWGFPGGAIELGEDIAAAARRELTEETGIQASPTRVWPAFSVVQKGEIGQITGHFILHPVACLWQSGEGNAASDAASLCWADRATAATLDCHPRVLELFDRLIQEFSHVSA